MKMSRKQQQEIRKYEQSMRKQFPDRNTYAVLETESKDTTVVTRTSFCYEPMSGCEEIAFDVEINREWVLRTSVLEAMRAASDGEGDPILQFASQFQKIADGILAHYAKEIDRQLALDLKWMKENSDSTGAKRAKRHAAEAKRRIAKARKGGR